MGRLDGKIALVTGGGAGIGEAIARRFRAEGARLVVNDLDRARAERVAAAVGGRAVAADVADSKAVAQMFEAVRAHEGRLDVLVNNAGIAGHESNPDVAQRFVSLALAQMQERTTLGRIETHADATLDTTDEDWRRMIAVHLDGTFFCTREALRLRRSATRARSSTWARSWGPRAAPGHRPTARPRPASSASRARSRASSRRATSG